MLGVLDLFNDPTQQPCLGVPLHEDFLAEFGPPALLTVPLGEERAFDWSSNFNHGSLNGGVTITPGGFGTLGAAWKGNGASGSNITTPVLPFTAVAPITLWAVVIPTSVASFQSLLYCGDATNEFGILISSAGQVWANEQSGTSNAKAIGGSISANVPSLVCGVYDSAASRKIYLNGSLVGTDTTSLAASSTSPRGVLFTRWHQTGQEFAGNILAGGISLNAFTATQISTLYNCLFTGEPYPLFAASPLTRFYSLPSGGAFNQSLASGLSFAGSENRLVSKGLSSSLSFTGLQIKQMAKQHLAALSFTGSSKQGTGKGIAGSLSFTGAINKGVTNKLTGTLSFASSVKRGTAKALSGTLSFSGTVIHSVLKTLAATLSFGGSVGRTITYKLAAFLSFAASLSNGHSQQVNLDAVLSFSGNVNRSISKAVSAALSFAGSAARNVGKGLSGVLGFGGTISRSILKTFTGGLSFGGSLNNGVAKLLLKLRRWLSDE